MYSPILDFVRNFIFLTAAAGNQALIIFHAAEHKKKRKNNAAFEPSAIVLKHVINKTKFYRLEPRAFQIQECNSTSLDSNP